jgi:AraC-like DNA-binding protein
MKAVENILPNRFPENEFQIVRFNEGNICEYSHKQEAGNVFHTFIFIQNGNGVLNIDYEENIAIEGKIFFLEDKKYWKWEKWNQLEGIMVLFTDLFFQRIVSENVHLSTDKLLHADMLPFIFVEGEEEQDWDALFSQLEKETQTLSAYRAEIAGLYLRLLVLKYFKNAGGKEISAETDHKSQLISSFKILVNSEFIKLKTPRDYAEKLHITPNYLNGLCKEVLDKTAGEIIRDRVVLEARRMLITTGLTVAEISFQLGFADNSYFGRYFRKASGVPPEKYRNIYCEKETS